MGCACNLLLRDSIFCVTRLFSSAGFLFHATSIMSSGSGAADHRAGQSPGDGGAAEPVANIFHYILVLPLPASHIQSKLRNKGREQYPIFVCLVLQAKVR